MQKRLVQLYTGNGKGKTSAALGTVLRSVGHGLRVCIVSFMKGDYPYGEYETLRRLPEITVMRFGRIEFVDPDNILEIDRDEACKALEAAREAIFSGLYDVVVLDEVNIAAGWNLIKLEDVIDLVKSKPPNVELILTGRYADPLLIACADLVTEMVEVQHPYRKGIQARPGFEY
ncbi:MAG: cob(I)yrinic acid a,c-diamide adenosyltransferase [Dehalococcoidia bacterium]|nr:cob(I)yrinic acid a,c-diamide adenosyltransferase [Dehalococcoidia bacterium]